MRKQKPTLELNRETVRILATRAGSQREVGRRELGRDMLFEGSDAAGGVLCVGISYYPVSKCDLCIDIRSAV